MIRKTLANRRKPQVIRWRSHEPSRLETFSDAVFAFAVTLIIVSLEVPKTFNELFETMKGFPSFAVCFWLLFNIWNGQNMFFRRYGLTDHYTTNINGILLFVVLMYVYPLKFLFAVMFSDGVYTEHGHTVQMISLEQVPTLMYLYSIGYCCISFLFFMMYRHAKKQAHLLDMTPAELFETDTLTYINIINMGVALLCMLLTYLLPQEKKGMSGMIYFLLVFTYSGWFSYRGRQRHKKFGPVTEQTV